MTNEQKLREALQQCVNILSIVSQDYNDPRFTDRGQLGPRIKKVLKEAREVLSLPTSDEGTPVEISALRSMARVLQVKGDEYTASLLNQAADTIHAKERELADTKSALEIEQRRYAAALAELATLQSVSAAPQSFWVVEKLDDKGVGGKYWDGGSSVSFVSDINKAIHFCRHDDAFWTRRSYGWDNVKITEHLYFPTAAPQEGKAVDPSDFSMGDPHPCDATQKELEALLTPPAATDRFVRVPGRADTAWGVSGSGVWLQQIGTAWVRSDGAVWEFNASKDCEESLGLRPVPVYIAAPSPPSKAEGES